MHKIAYMKIFLYVTIFIFLLLNVNAQFIKIVDSLIAVSTQNKSVQEAGKELEYQLRLANAKQLLKDSTLKISFLDKAIGYGTKNNNQEIESVFYAHKARVFFDFKKQPLVEKGLQYLNIAQKKLPLLNLQVLTYFLKRIIKFIFCLLIKMKYYKFY